MFGHHINRLSVFRVTSASDVMLWQRIGEQDSIGTWFTATVNFSAETGDVIMFEATVGSEFSGDIGVDDVRLKSYSC